MKSKIKILVADDHPLFRKGLVDVLRADASLEIVKEAVDGAEALKFIRELQPAVAVLDIEMPRLSGLEVATEMRKGRLPVELIFITAYKDPETFDEAMTLGVKGYVLKESAAMDIVTGIKAVARGEHYISPSLSDLLVRRLESAKALRAERPGLAALTPAERRILKSISLDRTTKEIADDLGVSYRTIENHRANIARKLGLQGSYRLLKFAYDNKSEL